MVETEIWLLCYTVENLPIGFFKKQGITGRTHEL